MAIKFKKPLGVNAKMGYEPENEDLTNNIQLGRALHWYNNYGTIQDSQEIIVTYMNKLGHSNVADRFKKLNNVGMSYIKQLGWLLRLIDRGCIIGAEALDQMEDCFQKLELAELKSEIYSRSLAPAVKKPKPVSLWPTVLEIIENSIYADKPQKSIDVLQLLEEYKIPKGDYQKIIKPIDLIRKELSIITKPPKDVLSAYKERKSLMDKYNDLCDRIADRGSPTEIMAERLAQMESDLKDVDNADAQLLEMEIDKSLAKKQHELAVSAISQLTQVKSSGKKVRKKKPIDAAKMASKVKYLQKFDELNLNSIRPELCVGAKRIVAYNVKYKKISIWNAVDGQKFIFSGSTLKNVDTGLSKTLRKPKEFFEGYGKMTLAQQNKRYKALKTKEQQSAPRLNEHTIILRADV